MDPSTQQNLFHTNRNLTLKINFKEHQAWICALILVKNCICLESHLLSSSQDTSQKRPDCYRQVSSTFWPENVSPLGDGSWEITMGKFLERHTESFNPLSTLFFTFYSQRHWGFCVYLYSLHATSPWGERRTAAILQSYKILSQKCILLLPLTGIGSN